MNVAKNKKYEAYDYICRYTNTPYYYNTVDEREFYGIGSNLSKDTAWVVHRIAAEDSLDYLALKYYNNPTYWWVIAYFNDIQDPFIDLYGNMSMIKIPAISSIKFGDER